MLSFGSALPYRPRRVLVAGVSGSGKTTLAGRIAAITGEPHTEIDSLFHGPGWVTRPEFLDDVRDFSSADSWTTEWQYGSARATGTPAPRYRSASFATRGRALVGWRADDSSAAGALAAPALGGPASGWYAARHRSSLTRSPAGATRQNRSPLAFGVSAFGAGASDVGSLELALQRRPIACLLACLLMATGSLTPTEVGRRAASAKGHPDVSPALCARRENSDVHARLFTRSCWRDSGRCTACRSTAIW